MNFKLIAIRPLGKSKDNLKNLKSGELYYFLNEFTINDTSIKYTPILHENFFTSSKLQINVSAVVGKNGSGKSNLIELLIRAVNNLSAHYKIKTDIEISLIPYLKLELYFQSGNFYYKIKFDKALTIFKQPLSGTRFTKIPKDSFRLQEFFYSIIVNYSHYGLNSRDSGPWINSLFHKNDGYQTPIVINPMREEGRIDINNEIYLAKSRLVANIIKWSISGLNENLKITSILRARTIQLKLNVGNNEVLYRQSQTDPPADDSIKIKGIGGELRLDDLNVDPNAILEKLNKLFNFGFKGDWESGGYTLTLAHRYIIRKLVRIAITYPIYQEFFDEKKGDFENIDTFFVLLFKKNQNHISYKLKQTINFIKYKHIEVTDHKAFEISIEDYASRVEEILKKNRRKPESIIELIPPPIFNVDIIMESETLPHEIVHFNFLSSGEKQLILSANSILYHINNLDSIRNTGLQKAYKYVNLILDEIELYFHPNMQREFVGFLLKRLNDSEFKNIKAIHMCFVTHSPFILSDIPNHNILFMDDNGYPLKEPVEQKTFGSNIHDLLKDSFFLKDGPMGEFAKEKINDTINFLNYKRQENELKLIRVSKYKPDAKILALKEKELKDLRSIVKDLDQQNHKEVIGVIGEPLLQIKLSEMYDEVTGEKSELEIIDSRIKHLQELYKIKSKEKS